METINSQFGLLTYYPDDQIFRDSLGNAYEYDQDFNLRAVATTSGSNPYNIKDGNYDKVLNEIAPGVIKKINETQTAGESWIDTLTKLIPALTLTTQQVQLMQLNVERAKKGLPPVDIASYSGIGVNVGLSGDTKNLLIYGGIALVAVFFLTRGR